MISKISIISSSARIGRNSHRAALYFQNFIHENSLATCEILDLKSYQFPIFDERLRFQKNPTQSVLEFAEKVKKSDGIIIVTPEYNGGYPASLKNAIDLLYDEWYRKPIAISTASDGDFGGTQVITSLQFSLWKIRSLPVPAMFPIPRVQEAFDESGIPQDKIKYDKRAERFIGELLWWMEAKRRMES